jgi:hypothetical protein
MRVVLKSLFLSLTIFAVLPAWHSCYGQDSTIATEPAQSSQQPQQDSSQKPAATSPGTNPSSQRTTIPPPSTTAPSSSLDDTVDAGEMDDDIDHAPRGMAQWNEYRGPYIASTSKAIPSSSRPGSNSSSEDRFAWTPQRLGSFTTIRH